VKGLTAIEEYRTSSIVPSPANENFCPAVLFEVLLIASDEYGMRLNFQADPVAALLKWKVPLPEGLIIQNIESSECFECFMFGTLSVPSSTIFVYPSGPKILERNAKQEELNGTICQSCEPEFEALKACQNTVPPVEVKPKEPM
jgi:hypothetical protein